MEIKAGRFYVVQRGGIAFVAAGPNGLGEYQGSVRDVFGRYTWAANGCSIPRVVDDLDNLVREATVEDLKEAGIELPESCPNVDALLAEGSRFSKLVDDLERRIKGEQVKFRRTDGRPMWTMTLTGCEAMILILLDLVEYHKKRIIELELEVAEHQECSDEG